MGIETRKNRLFYYRKARQGRRVVSVYVAGGELAQLWARVDRAERLARALARDRRQERDAAQQAEQIAALGLERQGRQLASLALLALGHYQHRGQWRRRRSTMGKRRNEEGKVAEVALAADPATMGAAEVVALMRRCNRVDAAPADVAQLRAALAAQGERGLVKAMGDALRSALTRELSEQPMTDLARELARDYYQRRRQALGYADAPALEKPLIDHLLLCEVRLGFVEEWATATRAAAEGGRLSLETLQEIDRQLDAAQRRYLRAVETLARVRRVRVELLRVTGADGARAEAVALEGPGR